MKTTNSNKAAYKAPEADVLGINVRRVLCDSQVDGTNTETVTVGDYSYDDDDFE